MKLISLEDIVIQRSARRVFAVLTEPAFFTRTSPSTSNVRAQGTLGRGSKFKRTFTSHGIPNWQTVQVDVCDAPRALALTTRLLLMRVRYTYRLVALGQETTLLTLRKEAETRIPWGVLLVHLLTAEEHEGAHLACLREVAESLPA
jgi:hypothetical protein